LNEGADDLAEAVREMEKEGENFRWRERTTRVVYPYNDRNLGQWKKRNMDQNHPQHNKERGGGVSNGRATADWGKQVSERTV
jgi:hypothetical protein